MRYTLNLNQIPLLLLVAIAFKKGKVQMSEYTKIAWADSTWNPWIGCARVSPACKHCYAEAMNKRFKWNGGTWGPKALRGPRAETGWRGPITWEGKAEVGRRGKDGNHWFVFAGDLCDIFDPLGPMRERERMWELFCSTPHLTSHGLYLPSSRRTSASTCRLTGVMGMKTYGLASPSKTVNTGTRR
jgi:protein gp37